MGCKYSSWNINYDEWWNTDLQDYVIPSLMTVCEPSTQVPTQLKPITWSGNDTPGNVRAWQYSKNSFTYTNWTMFSEFVDWWVARKDLKIWG